MSRRWVQPVTLEGRRVRLEPLAPRHAAGLASVATPELFLTTPQGPPEFSEAGFLEDIARVNALPDVVAFAVVDRSTGEPIGRTTYMRILPEHASVEIGRTWLGAAHHGTGVNTDMKLLMIGHAFEALDPPAARVEFRTDARNARSRRAIAKLGAVFEGVLRRDTVVPGGPSPGSAPIHRDTAVFSVVPEEWPAVRARLEAALDATPG